MNKDLSDKQKKNVLIRYMRSLKQAKSPTAEVSIIQKPSAAEEEKSSDDKLTEWDNETYARLLIQYLPFRRAIKELNKVAAGEPVVEYKANKRFLKTTIDQCLSFNKRQKTKERTMSKKNLEKLNEGDTITLSESESSSSCQEVEETSSANKRWLLFLGLMSYILY